MSTALAIQPEKWTEKEIQLLKDTVCKGVTDEEFKLFQYAVKRTGLDPFMKQIHAVKRWDSKLNRDVMSIQVGIDGYRLTADRSGFYAGNEEIIFDNEKNPSKAMATVYKMVNGQRCAFKASARWSEYYPGDKMGFMWKKMPCVMLGKVAEAIALRMAFPAELSGIYTKEEMDQADGNAPSAQNSIRDVSNEVVAPKPLPSIQKPSQEANSGESGGVKPKLHFPTDVREELQKIIALQKDLQLPDSELKTMVSVEFRKASLKDLNLEELKATTEELKWMLGKKNAPAREPGSDDVPMWEQETMGPMGMV